MTMILCAKTKTGVAIVADKQNRIYENGEYKFENNLKKFSTIKNTIVYNHGYNMINNEYWLSYKEKLNKNVLFTDIYQTILKEMETKIDKIAHYVFIEKSRTEIIINANDNTIKTIDHGNFIKSGSGTKYITDLPDQFFDGNYWNNIEVKLAQTHLIEMFNIAYDKQVLNNDNLFSKEYDHFIKYFAL